MSWLYGQTWLWYLLAFVVGVLLAWLFLVLPAGRRLRALERGRPAAATGEREPAAPAAEAATPVALRKDERRPAVDDVVTEQIPAVDPALSTLDTSRSRPDLAAGAAAAGIGAAGVGAAGIAAADDNETTREIPRVSPDDDTREIDISGGQATTVLPVIPPADSTTVIERPTDTSTDGCGAAAAGPGVAGLAAGGAAVAASNRSESSDADPSDATTGADAVAGGAVGVADADGTTEADAGTTTAADPAGGTGADVGATDAGAVGTADSDGSPGPGAAALGATAVGAGAVGAAAVAASGGSSDETPVGSDIVTSVSATSDPDAAASDAPARDTPTAGAPAESGSGAATATDATFGTDPSAPTVDTPTADTPTADGPSADGAATGGAAALAAGAVGAGAVGVAAASRGSDDAPFGPGSARATADGTSPDPAFGIKGNVDTMRYHGRSSPYFERTRAAVWFRTGHDAEQAGFVAWNTRGRIPHSPAVPATPQGLLGTPDEGVTAPVVSPGRFPGSALPLEGGAAPTAEHTIKGNADSMLYHTPESPYFGRTKAEVWFTSTADAEAAGFSDWKRHAR